MLKVEGDIFYALGEYKKALKCYVERAKILKKMHGEKNSDYSSALNDLGDILAIRDKYKEALGYHKIALKIDEEMFGREHGFNAESLYNIGNVLFAQGKCEEALEYFNRGLEIIDKAEAPGWYISFIQGIGEVLEYREDYEKALEKFDEGLQLTKKYYSGDKYQVSWGLGLKGRVLYKLGKNKEALKCQQQALNIRKKPKKTSPPE
ncbi:hypothetical protein I862_04185 [endosymbiont of Acanthamoeba sp. UWC8]|uniref:tetratricopeptide repeat protein n=1 Tax=endosymbiont of Acanthamoeba sp. UWC8 TaxID=86106 RepID=UPI0004D1E968|nr:tetratricopeptide repeat protein [endosymbiont of Acanthamoeba sp. UWC8]AIF81397.1 hypothetical protein I862_04185 [endosymbiont of Acanthamoeba sp. UWC8]